MNLKFRIFAGITGSATVLLIALALQSSGKRTIQPPLTGWMEKFTPTVERALPPALAFRNQAGAALNLETFAGRIVLVNFWATWCAPCIREMPSLARLQLRLGSKSFTVIALSEDRMGYDVITPFIAKHNLRQLPVFHDTKSQSLLTLKILGLPTSVLFDRKGRELGRLTGVAEWDSDEAAELIKYYQDRD